MKKMIKILFVGDVFASVGRRVLSSFLKENKNKIRPDLIVANVENATHGKAISLLHYEEMKRAGVDFFTLGNHLTSRPERSLIFEKMPDLVWPANAILDGSFKVRTSLTAEIKGRKICILSLVGKVYMKNGFKNPFSVLQSKLEEEKADIYLVDFHAEATAEKIALALAFDGKVGAVLGTHTHVPTADSRILPKGTFFQSDVGMTGAYDSIIGSKPKPIIEHNFDPSKAIVIEPAKGRGQFCGVLISFDETTNKVADFESFYIVDPSVPK